MSPGVVGVEVPRKKNLFKNAKGRNTEKIMMIYFHYL